MHFSSRVLNPLTPNDPQFKGSAVPLNRSSSFTYDTAEEVRDAFQGKADGYVYTRIGNPTVNKFEGKMAELCGGVGAIAFASGMAAVSTAMLSLTYAGSNVVVSTSLFVGSFQLFNNSLQKFGVEVRFFTPGEEDKVGEQIDENTACVFTEVVGNPKMDFADLEILGDICAEKKVPFVVDATVLAPPLLNPKDFKASLIVHSTTKSISGQSRAVGGVLIDTGKFNWAKNPPKGMEGYAKKFRRLAYLKCLRSQYLGDFGACMAPDIAELTMMGLETCELRVERQSANAEALAAALQECEEVKAVNYIGLPNNKFHEVAKRHCHRGIYGGFFAFDLGTEEKAFEFINKSKLGQIMTNLGDVRTLLIHPASTIYWANTEEEHAAIGVTPGLVRVSVGIENTDDLVNDFINAIKG